MIFNKLCNLEDWNSPALDGQPQHRKNWEYHQILDGLPELDCIRPDAHILAVGAGHESPLYHLTNWVRQVYATDIYGSGGFSSSVDTAASKMLIDPDAFAPCPYNRKRLVVQYMNALDLRFEDNFFDASFSISSIEHFGGIDAAIKSLQEMARVLKPGGIAAIITEFIVNGAGHFSSTNLQLFTRSSLQELLAAEPSLALVEPIDFSVSPRTLATVMELDQAVQDAQKGIFKYPHIVLRYSDRDFTSISVFLRKL